MNHSIPYMGSWRSRLRAEAPRALFGALKTVAMLSVLLLAGASVRAAPVVATASNPVSNVWLFDGPQALFVDQGQSAVSGIAFGAGRWVASGGGWVTTLDSDGQWSYPRMPRYLAENWSRVAYVGGLFLLFGANPDGVPELLASADGLDWNVALGEAGPSPFTFGGNVRAVAYGNGTWVAVGAQWFSGEQPAGAIFRSTDGYHWSRVHRVENPWRTVQGVAFADGRFLAVADSGTLLSSTDGSNWSETRPITDPGNPDSVWMSRNLVGVCHGGLGWVIPTSVSGVALVSLDGVNWNVNQGTPFSGEFNQSFFADGKYWFGMPGNVYTTTDAINWVKLAALGGTHPVSVVARGPDGLQPNYLANGPAGSVLSSSNGIHWDVALPASDAGWPRYLSALAVGTEWLVSGQGTIRTDRNGPYDRPAEGQIWIPSLGMGFANNGVGLLALRDQGYSWRNGAKAVLPDLLLAAEGVLAVSVRRGEIAAGFLSGTTQIMNTPSVLPDLNRFVTPQTYKGQNSINWEYGRASLTRTAGGFDLFAETYSKLDGFNFDARIRWGHFTSSDGHTWTLRPNGLNDVTAFPGIRGLAWGAGRFVAVSEGSSPGLGADFTSPHRIYTSVDGESYSPVDLTGLVPPLDDEGLTGIAYSDGKFVAIGNAGRIVWSENGLDWVTARPSDGRRWNRIRHLGSVWGAVGDSGGIGFSSDGFSWLRGATGVESDLNDIAFRNGQYLLVGSHAMALISPPGASIEALVGISTESIPNQIGQYGVPFNFTFDENVFADPDTGQTLTYSASGVPTGISLDGTSRTFSGTPTSTGNFVVTVHATDPYGETASSTFAISIARAPLEVVTQDASRVYGDPNPVFTGTVTGLKNGDIMTVGGWSAAQSSPVGQYAITPVLNDSGNKQGNYTISYGSGVLTITPAPAEAITFDASRVYGDPNPAFTGTIVGLKNGDNITVGGWSAAQSSPVGAYGIIHIFNDPDSKLGNYHFSYLTGTLTIRPAPLEVVTLDATRMYGDPNPVFTGTAIRLKNGDNITVGGWSAGQTSPVGDYSIVPILNDPGSKQGNYTISYGHGTLTISRAPLDVVTQDASRVYGDPNPVFTGTATGLKNGDNITVGGWSAGQTSPVGDYSIVPILNDPGSKQGNYSISYGHGTLTITPAPLIITADNQQKVYGAPNPPLTVSYTGFVNGDAPANLLSQPTVATEAAQDSIIGSYEIVVSGATAANYQITFVSGALTIYGSPIISAITPNGAVAGAEGFTMIVYGPFFAPDAVVLWDGVPLTEVSRSETQLGVSVPSEAIAFTPDVTTIPITVRNSGGYLSSPVPFTIVRNDVKSFNSAFVTPGSEPVTISSSAQTEVDPSITASLSNTGGDPVAVTVATYQDNPAPTETTFDSGGGYVDLKIEGADEADTATVSFYYPTFITGELEQSLQLLYWKVDTSPEGGTWMQVLSSGSVAPTKELRMTNPDGTISGGRFIVEFSATSQPAITEMSGTFFALVDSTPVIQSFAGPSGPVAIGIGINVSVFYRAIGTAATQRIRFDWGDGAFTEGAPSVAGSAAAGHAYLTPGVYTVEVTVSDIINSMATSRFEYAVVYDPKGGFVTGGGWIWSPAGALHPGLQELAAVDGKANFGFVAKYLKGATVPTGSTEFQFRAGDLNFKSTAYQWLVVAGAKAQYKGEGTINSEGGYGFLLTATDGQVNGGGGADKLRMKIWALATETVVYDNVSGASNDLENASPQAIGGGSIVIHTK